MLHKQTSLLILKSPLVLQSYIHAQTKKKRKNKKKIERDQNQTLSPLQRVKTKKLNNEIFKNDLYVNKEGK